ncbi:MAG TPA: recombinase family protein [Solirubrobacterales bacterium]|nr:recombinase family protein [Solirubrobacterales bacterium]
MRPAILYAAKSTADTNVSIPAQLREGRELAEAEGRSVVAEFKDENKSAFTGDRGPELAKAREVAEELAREHGECALIVQHSDRLARGDGIQAAHLVEYALWAIKSRVKILSKHDPDTFAHDDLIYPVLTGHRNHEDSKRKSQAVQGGIGRRVRDKGLATGGGRRRYGYRWADDRSGLLLVVPAEAEVVEHRIYRATLAGVSGLQIARELEADGIKTVTGARWHGGTISQILHNPLYKGVVTIDGEEHPGQHEAIVDPELWGAVADLLRQRRRKAGGGRGRRPAGRHLFRKGMLKCICGESMVPRTVTRKLKNGETARYEHYECYGHHRDPSSCPVSAIRRDAIDPQVFRYFERVGVDVEATRAQLTAARDGQLSETRALLAEAQREADKARERLARIEGDYMDGALKVADWERFNKRLTEELSAAEGQVERLASRLEEVEQHDAGRDLEVEVVEKLAAIRASVAGEVADASGADAARAAIQRLFEGFTLRRIEPGLRVPGELAWADGGDYVLEPQVLDGVVLRSDAIVGADNYAVGVVT